MNSIKWFSLSDSNKAIWDHLDNKSKSIIFGNASSAGTFSSLMGGSSLRPVFSTPHFPPTFPGKNGTGTKPSFGTQAQCHNILAYDFLTAYLNTLVFTDDAVEEDLDSSADPMSNSYSPDTCVINAAKSFCKSLPPGDICCAMFKSSTCHVKLAHIEYRVSLHDSLTAKSLFLFDPGTNGVVSGKDVLIIFQTNCNVDINGIVKSHVNDNGIGTVGGVVQAQRGPVIAIMHQYALLGEYSSIHSPSQLEWY
jgi:hypothetical protein